VVETSDPTKAGAPTLQRLTRARPLKTQVERYWLCDECAAQWTLIYDRQQGVTLLPARRPVESVQGTAVDSQSGVA
jgi:hypothetical protein